MHTQLIYRYIRRAFLLQLRNVVFADSDVNRDAIHPPERIRPSSPLS